LKWFNFLFLKQDLLERAVGGGAGVQIRPDELVTSVLVTILPTLFLTHAASKSFLSNFKIIKESHLLIKLCTLEFKFSFRKS